MPELAIDLSLTGGIHSRMPRYEELAAELRDVARAARTPEARDELTQLVEQYERLARRQKTNEAGAARTPSD